MAAFALGLTAQQSVDDGLSVLFTDISNWGSNDEGYADTSFVRQLILKDYLNNTITTIPLADGVFTATWPVPSDTNPWVKVDYNAVDSAIPLNLDLIQKYPFQRQFELKYMDAVKASCGCCPGKHPDMCEVDALLSNAEFCVPIGDAADYQNFIDSAYKILIAQ